jgi:hypothetical protein
MAIVKCECCNKRIDLDYEADTFDFDRNWCGSCVSAEWAMDKEPFPRGFYEAHDYYGVNPKDFL